MLLWLAVLLASLPGLVHANPVRCIGTVQELVQAFVDVDGRQTGELTLRLQSGTYEIDADLQLSYRENGGHPDAAYGALRIIGGFAPGCVVPSSPSASTHLVAVGDRRMIGIELINNALLLEGVASSHIDWSISSWQCRPRRDPSARISRMDLAAGRLRLDGMGCYDVLLHGSQIEVPPDGLALPALAYQATRMPGARSPSFSVSASTLRGGALDLAFLAGVPGEEPEPADVRLHGSVFESFGPELVINGGNLRASHNRFDSLSITRGKVWSEIATVSAPARLHAGGRPMPHSPLINAGTRSMPGGLPDTDLSGMTRLVGTQPDIGAFETAIDDSTYLDVTSAATTGPGSLAAAVALANSMPGRQVIRFAIPGPCPHVITLNDTLVLTQSADIVGASQAGSVANTRVPGYNGVPCVILRDGFASAALVFDGAVLEDSLRISDLAFSAFLSSAIRLKSGRGHLLTGNQFGGRVGDFELGRVGTAIRVELGAGSVQVGGPDAAQTNLIGSANSGIVLGGAGSSLAVGNAIGDDGLVPLPSTIGVQIVSPDNVVADNWIGESLLSTLVLTTAAAQRNQVRGNRIFDIGIWGVEFNLGAFRNRIGPDNHLAGSRNAAIYVGVGTMNNLSGNTYADNDAMAIDLGAFGVTPNDPDPLIEPIDSSNRNQNFPVLRRAFPVQSNGTGQLALNVDLSSTEGEYLLEVYRNADCEPAGHGDGSTLLAATTVQLACPFLPGDNQCLGSFDLVLPAAAEEGQLVSATVTSPAGHTSEFSACLAVDNGDHLFADGFD